MLLKLGVEITLLLSLHKINNNNNNHNKGNLKNMILPHSPHWSVLSLKPIKTNSFKINNIVIIN